MTNFNTVKQSVQEAARLTVQGKATTAQGRSKSNYAACLYLAWLQDNDAPTGKDGNTVQALFALTDEENKAIKGALSSAALIAKRGSLPVDVERKGEDGESVTVTVTLADFDVENAETLASVQTTAQAIRKRDKVRRERVEGASRMEVNAFEAALEMQERGEDGRKVLTIGKAKFTDAQACVDGMHAALANGDAKAFQAFQTHMSEGMKAYNASAKEREAAEAALHNANALAGLSHDVPAILKAGGEAAGIALAAFERMQEAVAEYTAQAEKQAANG